MQMLYQIIISMIILVLALVVQQFAKSSINNFVEARQLKRFRGQVVGRIFNVVIWLGAGFLLILVWGVNTQNLWLFATGVVGVLAVAFFASWSMLSNVVAGLFLFMSDPFRVDDEIVVLPEEIQGMVKDVKMLFIVLEDKDGNVIHIPSNLFFQKIIKKINTNDPVNSATT